MNTLTESHVAPLLDRLFKEAEAVSPFTIPAVAALSSEDRERMLQSKTEYLDLYGRLKDAALPVSRETCVLLYLLARSTSARTIVEFGTSFGISTLHLAAALARPRHLRRLELARDEAPSAVVAQMPTRSITTPTRTTTTLTRQSRATATTAEPRTRAQATAGPRSTRARTPWTTRRAKPTATEPGRQVGPYWGGLAPCRGEPSPQFPRRCASRRRRGGSAPACDFAALLPGRPAPTLVA
jgi:hypothetical protein